jgi:hypothetical protein
MRPWLLALVLAGGCGRLNFGEHTGGDGGGNGMGDGTTGMGDGAGSACVQSSIQVSQSALRQWSPATAWNGSNVGIVWVEDPANANTGLFRTVTPTGTLGPLLTLENLGAGEVADIEADGASYRLAMAANGASAHRQVQRSTDGAAPIAVTSSGRDNIHARVAAIGAGSTAYAFSELAGGQSWNLLFAVVDANGTKQVNDVTIATGLNDPHMFDMVWTGSEIAVFFYAGTISAGNIEMQRLDTTGTLIGAAITLAPLAGPPGSVSASWASDRHLVTWMTGNGPDIVHVASDGTLLHPVRNVPVGGPLSLACTVAIGAGSDLVLWADIAADQSYFVPVSRDGTVGSVAMLAGASALAGVWTGSAWLIAAAQGIAGSEQMFLLGLCP